MQKCFKKLHLVFNFKTNFPISQTLNILHLFLGPLEVRDMRVNCFLKKLTIDFLRYLLTVDYWKFLQFQLCCFHIGTELYVTILIFLKIGLSRSAASSSL